MHETLLIADVLGQVGQKRDVVVAGLALELVEACDLDEAVKPQDPPLQATWIILLSCVFIL